MSADEQTPIQALNVPPSAVPCRNCSSPALTDFRHVYGERKCCPDCDHRPDPDGARILRFMHMDLYDPTYRSPL